MNILHICVCNCGGQKRVLGTVELELWVVLNHYVDARNPS